MNRRSGQVGIVLLLISVVMLTVGISVASRTTSDVNISTSNEVANRALDAAESGIEDALSRNLAALPQSTTIPTAPNADQVRVNTEVTKQNALQTYVDQGYVAGIDVSTASPQSITVRWARSTDPSPQASLIISIFSSASPSVRRIYVGPAGRGDNFTAAGGGGGGYSLSTQFNIQAGDQLVRIRPVYAGTSLQVTGSGTLPTQQYTVKSVAQSDVSKETKAVQVERSIPVPPAIFDYVLFSGTSITP